MVRTVGTLRTLAAVALAASVASVGLVGHEQGKARRDPASPSVRITTLVEDAGRLDWSARHNLIVFDRHSKNGVFDIYTITPEGRNERCLTCGAKGLDTKSRGNPSWHPSGEYIVFQGRNDYKGLGRFGLGKITEYFANPGIGINNDIWVMDKDAKRFWRLTEVPPRVGGVLHPHFSPAGDKLFWAERISLKGPFGEWALRIADFRITSSGPRISNIRLEQPGAQKRMIESHGFTADGAEVLFSGNLEPGQYEAGADIYLFNLSTRRLRNLTQSMKSWDEHAHISPDGKTIVWMSSKDLPERPFGKEVPTDYWLMNVDGSNKRRLTYFNTPGHPEYSEKGVIAADSAWGPDGKRIAGYLITDLKKGGPIVILDMR